jgi:hypothetical protein
MAEYYIGQIFTGMYPTDAAEWCNNNNAYIDEIEPENNTRRFQIKEQEPYVPTPEDIDKLTMTAWDFVNVLKQAGLNSNQIMMFLNSNPDIQLHLTCCQNVYCGVAKSLMPITYEGITITAEMVEKAFRDKHGV